MKLPTEPPQPDDPPGLPGFRTWRGLHTFILAFSAAVILLLALFSRVFA